MKLKKAVFLAIFLFFLSGQIACPQGELSTGQGMDTRDMDLLSLEDCVRYAVNNSFEVKLARLDLLIAETELMYSEAVYDTFVYGGAGYVEDKRQELSVFAPDDDQMNTYSIGARKTLPTGTELNAELSDVRQWSNSAFVSKNPSHNAELKLEAKQPVGSNFFGYVDRTRVTITKLAIMNADLETRDRIEELIAKVERAYWELASSKRSLDIYWDILEKARRLHQTNARNYDIGLIEKVDLYASEANVATIEAEVIIAENRFKRAGEDLKLIMNYPDKRDLLSSDELVPREIKKDLPSCFKEAFDNRRDYKIRKRDVKIKGLDLKVNANLMWPEIDLMGTMAMNGLETSFEKAMGKTTVADNTYYYAGVEFSFPLENREALSGYRKAKYEKESAIVSLKDTERTIITQVGNSYRDVVAFENSLRFMSQAVVFQKEKLEEEEKRFNYGRSNTKRLIDYQRELLRSQLEETRFLLDSQRSKVDLNRTMNVILSKYEDIL